MTPNPVILDLLKRHVLRPGEEVERVREWPDGLALTTTLRHFVAGSELDDWLITRADWVADLVVATRDDLIVSGQPEQFAFLLLIDGGEHYLNDAGTVAELGRRLPTDLDPVGYAELLVRFFPYSSAIRTVLTDPDDLRHRYRRDDLPAVPAFSTESTSDGVRLTFTSSTQYRRPIAGNLLDLTEWTVTVPNGQPATWTTHLATERIPLEPARG